VRVLDAHAVLAYLGNEAGWVTVEARLREAARTQPLRMCTVNWGEVLYVVARLRGGAQAEKTAEALEHLPIRLETADKELARAAALLKARYRVPYADCFAAALAQRLSVPLLTGDRDFRPLAKVIDLDWIA